MHSMLPLFRYFRNRESYKIRNPLQNNGAQNQKLARNGRPVYVTTIKFARNFSKSSENGCVAGRETLVLIFRCTIKGLIIYQIQIFKMNQSLQNYQNWFKFAIKLVENNEISTIFFLKFFLNIQSAVSYSWAKIRQILLKFKKSMVHVSAKAAI